MNRFSLAALLSGALFGLGLAASGMTDARRVLGFLDLFGDFDPTLAFVLGGAVVTTVVLFRLVLRRGRPVLASRFRLSSLRHVDGRLLGGAAIFGIGWGLAGYCPGPALAGLGVGSAEALWFVPAMLAGMFLHRVVSRS
ncbi:DUF6691 family protein [Pseudofulvimonas gallinarii]|uniref:Sulphur transport domain-containing protein n=1 Tax=Pseudofulvimonas gallinarii TaxID=634155 RepID=A0A4S3KYJ5_9GAMM|nr:DUF6691 family protein [Pseudofulvimonas gallinarii]TCS93506.1 hypothetical protein EDC25_1271 [Pseudofulvimonas gallinarii]THD14462.1 transporter [Pseudofulvimonas gallinarii]